MQPPNVQAGRVYEAVIHAQTGTSRRRVRVLRWIEELPGLGMVLVEDTETLERFVVHWLKLNR